MEIDLGEIRKDVQCPICLGTSFRTVYVQFKSVTFVNLTASSLGTKLLLKLESPLLSSVGMKFLRLCISYSCR